MKARQTVHFPKVHIPRLHWIKSKNQCNHPALFSSTVLQWPRWSPNTPTHSGSAVLGVCTVIL